jgi:hypothetical protein
MVWKWIKENFRHMWLPNPIMFSIFLEAWVLSITIIVTIKTVSNQSITMTYFWIASYVFIVLALLTLLRMRMEPKDNTTLKEIKEKLDMLIEMHMPPKQIDIGKVNKEIREYMMILRNRKLEDE